MLRRLPRPLLFIALALAAAAPLRCLTSASFEVPDRSPEQLFESATHVAVGRVLGIYEYETKDSNWQRHFYLAEIQVEGLEKGERAASEELFYARYWTKRWRGWGQPPADTNGHRGLPSVGDRVRVYTAVRKHDGFGTQRDDSGFNVVGPNGFEVLPAEEATEESTEEPDEG